MKTDLKFWIILFCFIFINQKCAYAESQETQDVKREIREQEVIDIQEEARRFSIRQFAIMCLMKYCNKEYVNETPCPDEKIKKSLACVEDLTARMDQALGEIKK